MKNESGLLVFQLAFLSVFLIFSLGCKKDAVKQLPVLSTEMVSNISKHTASSGGNITSDGGATITSRGVCWGTSSNPNITNNTTSDGTGKGTFTSNITGLTPSTTYYVRAFATNSAGTAYGAQQTFTTQAPTPTTPTITTTSITNVTQTTASGGGNVTSEGSAAVTARGVCWSTSPNPTTANSTTSNGTGTGSFTSNITGLNPSTTYYVRAYATNSAGTAYGNQVDFTTSGSTMGVPCPGMPTMTDYNGNVYNTVQIGNQCWMKENLKVRNYRNGTSIPNTTDSTTWVTLTTDARCWYNNDSATYAATYGALYNYYAVDNTNGLCPTGWHVPTDLEWQTLEMFLGMSQSQVSASGFRGTDEGGKMKETGLAHWNSPNTGATNSSDFTALPGGYRYSNGIFASIRDNGYWWPSSAYSSTSAWYRMLWYSSSKVVRLGTYKRNGHSVRCVRD